MAFERQTAKKVFIKDIVTGKWVKKEGMEPSFVVTEEKEKVARGRIMGTIVQKFTSEDGTFASVTVDDGTDTIRCKGWRELDSFTSLDVGQMVDVVGKVREYNGEIYMIPELFIPYDDVNRELLRKLEIQKQKEVRKKTVDVEAPEESAEEAKEKVRKEILKLLDEHKDGIRYTDILAAVQHPEPIVESVITDILEEGICYEPTPGKIMKI